MEQEHRKRSTCKDRIILTASYMLSLVAWSSTRSGEILDNSSNACRIAKST